MNSQHTSRALLAVLSLLAACQTTPAPETTATQAALVKASGTAFGTADLDGLQRSPHCSCTRTYRGGREQSVSTCDNYGLDCPDLNHVEECQHSSSPECEYLIDCTCDCTGPPEDVFDHDPSDGVYLTGIPDLWQFSYECGGYKGAWVVGCGPVALASLFYWWAERGYDGLVEDHRTADGLEDWQSLVRELRDDYADGGFCINQEYGTTQDRMVHALTSYPADHGYSVFTNHYRVCGDCDANGLNDLTTSEGLDVITEHLEAGRPLILGFNVGKMDDSSDSADGETFFTGELSNGIGWIDHYAVITGYHRTSDGRDIIYLNLESTSHTGDLAVEWNPAGKWVHLFTFSIPEDLHGKPFCTLDEPLSDVFSNTTDLELSHFGKFYASATRQFTPLVGAHCGVAKDGTNEVFQGQWTEGGRCALTIPKYDVVNDGTDGTVDLGSPRDEGGNPFILDQLGPGP